MKILDLDASAPPVRQIKIGGRVLDLAPRTFGALRRFREASKAAGTATDDQEGAVLAIVRSVIPGADQAVSDLLDPEGTVLEQILKHWAGQDDDEVEALAQDPPPPG